MKDLETLELPVVCKEVESLVSKGMHFAVYPERKALWETLKGSKGLHNLISVAKAKFVQVYHLSGKGADKFSRFYCAWLKYMASYTSDSPSTEKETWINLTTSCTPVSEDTRRVIICDILHSLQNYLMGLIAKDLEHKSTNEGSI